MMRRAGSAAIACAIIVLVEGVPLRAQPDVPEARLKAAVLSKLPQFVQWPAAALDGRASASVCVAPPDPFGSDLADLLAGDTVAGKPLAVVRVASEHDVEACQILYVPASGAQRAASMMRRAASLPILTVGDSPRFLDEGGIVALRMIDGRVRFEIDAAAAERAGLRVSSQLLQLAVAVRGAAR
jgi:hypothetical protein